MALVGALIGLPMFFEIGLVLLMPIIFLVARRSGLSLIKVGIPALAGLSVMHGLVPPHPGPLVAIAALNANLGITLALGVLIAIPTVAIAGPLFARYAARWVDVPAPHLFDDEPDRGRTAGGNPDRDGPTGSTGAATALERRTIERPTFATTLLTVLLPVVLMLGKALADIFVADKSQPGAQRPRLPRHPADRPAHRRHRGHVHPRPRRRDGHPRHRRHARAVPAPDRRHPADRRRGRRVQADPDRHQDRRPHRQLRHRRRRHRRCWWAGSSRC